MMEEMGFCGDRGNEVMPKRILRLDEEDLCVERELTRDEGGYCGERQ